MVSLLFDVLGILDQQLVLVNLQLVSLLSELDCLLLRLTEPPLDVVDVPAELPALVTVLGGVLNAQLQATQDHSKEHSAGAQESCAI